MSDNKSISAGELFKNYVPEILEYDVDVDATHTTFKSKTKKRSSSTEVVIIQGNAPVYSEQYLKNYIPEILEYDEDVDGTYEYKIREAHLTIKDELLEKIRKAKAARKSNKTTFRQPIRTENETT